VFRIKNNETGESKDLRRWQVCLLLSDISQIQNFPRPAEMKMAIN